MVIQLNSDNNVVQGNFIGTDRDGAAAVPNGTGVIINGSANNTIGGTSADARNIISGNNVDGLTILLAGATGNLVQGNYIGTEVDGATARGNGSLGVHIRSNAGANTIGGPATAPGCAAPCNIIGFNGTHGVQVLGSGTVDNTIEGNSIHSNTELGINLAGGTQNSFSVTTNDPGDGDTGPNNLQNFPVLLSATASSANNTTTVKGTLDSMAGATYTLEFFSDTDCDPSTHGEGRSFLGSGQLVNSVGIEPFDLTFPLAVAAGQVVTATARDPNGNTSEFAACVTVF